MGARGTCVHLSLPLVSRDCWAFTLFRLFLTTVTLLFLDLRLSTVQQGSQFEVRELVDHNDSGLGTGA